MIDDKDIKKLIEAQKKVFSTKEDLSNFKDSLKEDFATKKEIEYLLEIVATKDELVGLEKRLGDKIDNIGKGIKEIRSVLTDAHVL